LNFTFIPIYGYIFAAVSTFIAYFISFLVVIGLSKKHLTIAIDIKKILKILISSIFMFLVVTFFIQVTTFHKGIALILSALLGVTVYFTLLYILGIINEISEWVNYIKNR
jgi:O-antigen/teichoic acid export membrane protein